MRVWQPIIDRKIAIESLRQGEVIPVTCGADATPVPALPEYCEHRNIIVGLCGPTAPDHKCSLDPPVQIANGEAGFNQIVELVRGNVWASYVYVHILQPQVCDCMNTFTTCMLNFTLPSPTGPLVASNACAHFRHVQLL